MNQYCVICEEDTVYKVVAENADQAKVMAHNVASMRPYHYYLIKSLDSKATFSVKKIDNSEAKQWVALHREQAEIENMQALVEKEIQSLKNLWEIS